MSMTGEARVRDLFELPESIHMIAFVEVLDSAVRDPKATAEKYVVTPELRASFDRALTVVGKSLQDQRSQAAFLHGSFGSGKSHFMALLSLMLQANEEVWRIPELHALRAKHGFIGKKKLLELHFHMVGHSSLEEAIFSRYVRFVQENHASATIPGVFADAKLFEDAARMLEELGDGTFFAPMNAGLEANEAWGTFGRSEHWDRARFDAAVASSDTKVREELFSALVKSRFRAYAQESRQYVDLDTGLAVLARHAKELGYHGVILFLDEVILWLAGRASDVSWFHGEVQKLVKLVEAQDSYREIPIVSILARQRDLAEMVGVDYAGVENALLRDSLKWSELRYEKITLEDSNLPAIVERRVLRPKGEDAQGAIDTAFDKLKSGAAGSTWQTMLGSKLDAKAFRQLYPFSPALVDALVALSNSLQRQRTAIRLLTEILVEHIEDLALGEVVGVGDLFDVLAGGEDTADGVMRARFESAKEIYLYQFLPLIQAANATNTPASCQRLRPEHPARIGCSNCPQKGCRADNRLIKTLLIAALVPEVPVLKDLTAGKLAQLNHGSIRAPFGGDTASVVAQKLKTWAAKTSGQLHVGNEADPRAWVQLEGVDLGPILKAAQSFDKTGARQRVICNLLFEAMGIEPLADWGRDHKEEWRGTARLGHIRFGNVRKMGPETMRCPEGHDWRVIVDYPFDDPEFGPRDDEAVVEKFREEGGSWTLFWLPSFFSAEIKQMLGELVILERILEAPATTRSYVSHLSVENQGRAINDLTNLRTQKQSRVRQVLEQAYGLAKAKEGDLDTSNTAERHVIVAQSGAQVVPTLASSLADALPRYIEALLDARYPRHPKLTKKMTPKRVEELVASFGQIVDAEDKRIAADRALVEEMRGTLGELGLVRVTETAVHLYEDSTLQALENRRRQKSAVRPEVGELRRWIDEPGKMGLQPEALDLIVRCYARWAARTLVSGDRPYEAKAGKVIPDQIVLEKPDLPSAADWAKALVVADQVFGVQLPGMRALHGDNLKQFETKLLERVKEKASWLAKIPALLPIRLAELGAGAEADRLTTAVSVDGLVAAVEGKKGKALVEVLAAAVLKTSAKAAGSSVLDAKEVAEVLEAGLIFGVFAQLRARAADLAGAAELLENAASALRQDELNVRLAPRLKSLAEAGQALFQPPPPPPGKKERVVFEKTIDAHGAAELQAVASAFGEAVAKLSEGQKKKARALGRIEIRVTEGDDE
ncbi:MAG: hypothetical protein IT384_01640 [Deltaproteobacteria bacterium]|nr:hypothetical protein [Deltaproteobacteria bacterium]